MSSTRNPDGELTKLLGRTNVVGLGGREREADFWSAAARALFAVIPEEAVVACWGCPGLGPAESLARRADRLYLSGAARVGVADATACWDRGVLVFLAAPGTGKAESSREPTPMNTLELAVLGKFVIDTLAEYLERPAPDWR